MLRELTLKIDTRVTLGVELVQSTTFVLLVQITLSAVMKVMKLLRLEVVSAHLALIASM